MALNVVDSTMPVRIRGGFFQYFFDRLNNNVNVTYSVVIFKGRKLEELWLQAKAKICAGECDHVYVNACVDQVSFTYIWSIPN